VPAEPVQTTLQLTWLCSWSLPRTRGPADGRSQPGWKVRRPGKDDSPVDLFPWLFAVSGIAALMAALLPSALNRLPLSMPMVFLGVGIGI